MILQSMIVLATVNFIDAISYMSVAPSLVFYVLQLGGTKEQYGLIMSAFSFASFASKPVYGLWVDKCDNQFRMPYIASLVMAILGGFFYFFASWFEDNTSGDEETITSNSAKIGIAMILLGRVLGGFGAGNAAIGYAYLALTVPFEKQTQTNSMLSMTRIVGMALGPAVNILLGKIDTTWSIFGHTLQVTPLNSVGILLALANALVLLVVLIFLKEPSEHDIPKVVAEGGGEKNHHLTKSERTTVWHALFCLEITLPIFIIFVVNSCFQLVETALAPAAADSLGYGPIETSAILSASTVIIFISMIFVMVMSKYINDMIMVAIGAIFWIVGGTAMYFGWARDVPVWHFVVPIMIAVCGFPFIAASNRSTYSKSVASKPELESMQASMQAILSMAASIAGFVTPGFVAAYVVRTPEEVDAAGDDREMTPIALYSPILSSTILIGLFFLWRKQEAIAKQNARYEAGEVPMGENLVPSSEETPLVGHPRTRGSGSSKSRTSVVMVESAFSKQGEVCRRLSTAMIGGLPCPDTFEEKQDRESMMHDWETMKQLQDMDLSDVEED